MKNALIFLPAWNTAHPYLSLPCLSAFLKANGKHVTQIDLNIEWFWYCCEIEYIDDCYERIKEMNLDNDSIMFYEMIYIYLKENNALIKDIVSDKNMFYSFEYYHKLKKYMDLKDILSNMAYDGYQDDSGWNSLSECYTIKDLSRTASNKNNPYIVFFKKMISKYELNAFDFIGLSLIGTGQLIAMFTLLELLDKSHMHICVGGNTFSKIQYKIEEQRDLFDYIDSILLFEGEYPILQLINALEGKGSIDTVPNCIYIDRDDNIIKKNDIKQCIIPIEELPVPDFDGLPLDKYNNPEIILPYYISRSCYWGKCEFCDHDYGYDGKYRKKSFAKVFSDIKELQIKYNANIIYFVDEALSIPFLNEICRRNTGDDKFYWFGYIKASKLLTLELCLQLKKAGCLYLMVGIESCSEEVLKKMNKGITLEDIESTVSNMDKAGIWLHSFLINDFPTETSEDKLKTILNVFLMPFHSVGFSQFSLPRNAKITSKLDKYGLYDLKEKREFSSILEYKAILPPDRERYEELCQLYNTRMYNVLADVFLIDAQHIPLFEKEYNFIDNKLKLQHFADEIQKNSIDDLLIRYKQDETIVVFNYKTMIVVELPAIYESVLRMYSSINSCNSVDEEVAEVIRLVYGT